MKRRRFCGRVDSSQGGAIRRSYGSLLCNHLSGWVFRRLLNINKANEPDYILVWSWFGLRSSHHDKPLYANL